MKHQIEITDQNLRESLLAAVQEKEKARLGLYYQWNSPWSLQVRKNALRATLILGESQPIVVLRQSDKEPSSKYQKTFPLSALTAELRRQIEELIPISEILPVQMLNTDWADRTLTA